MGKSEAKQLSSVDEDCKVIIEDSEDVWEASNTSMESSSSSSDIVDDASSSISNSSSSSSSSSSLNGPLYELSELMAHLPIKRGLSKYYDGKSKSYTSIGSVKSLEDLAKRVAPIRKKIRSCKTFGGGFDGHRSIIPRAAISKKASRSKRRSSSFCGSRSAIPVNGN